MVGLKHSSQRSGSFVSSRHSNSMNFGGVTGSMPSKVNVAERLFVISGGFSRILVSGGSSAGRMSFVAGSGSTLSFRSTARTSKRISPSSPTSSDSHGLVQPTHWSSGGTGSHGAIGSSSSTSATS